MPPVPPHARFLCPNNDLLVLSPASAVVAGTPYQIAAHFWGVPAVDVTANRPGEFRISGNFEGKKANPASAMAVGDLIQYTAGQGFVTTAGSWRVLAASPSGDPDVQVQINAPSLAPATGGDGGGGAPEIVYPKVVEPSGHGLVVGDIGKPLNGSTLWDNSSADRRIPIGVIKAIVSGSEVEYYPEGATFDLPKTSLSTGVWTDGSSSRLLYYDLSSGKYSETLPVSSYGGCPPVLFVNSSASTTVNVTFFSIGWNS